MASNSSIPTPDSPAKTAVKLRIIGGLILLLGLAGAIVVYWKGSPPEDLSDDVVTPRNSKIQARAIQVNVGRMGLLVNDLMDDFQDPAIQAAAIAGVSALAACGCFYFAQLHSRDTGAGDPKA